MFKARRNSVSNSSDVGKTLNSTGRVMYIETSSRITEIVMFALMRISSRNEGIGAIIAKTMPKTAKGTLKSAIFPNRDADLDGFAVFALTAGLEVPPRECGAGPGRAGGCAETGAICGVAAMLLDALQVRGHLTGYNQ